MLTGMIYFDASSYSKRTYARFRSSLALERSVASPHEAGRAVSLRWARAWQLAALQPDWERRSAPLTSPVRVNDGPLNFRSGQCSGAREDVLD